MYDITAFVSCLIRITILEIPVFCSVHFIWKNFIGSLRFILILVLSLLVSGLFICLGFPLPSAEKIYLATNLDSASIFTYCLIAIAAVCLILAIIICIYLRITGIGYEEYYEDEEYED